MAEDNRALAKDICSIWQIAAALAVTGELRLQRMRDLTLKLHVWAAYIRNGQNKTHAALELGTSRRVVREVVGLIESDKRALPKAIRRVLLRDGLRPTFEEIVADLANGVGASTKEPR